MLNTIDSGRSTPDRWRVPRSLLFVPGDSERKQTKALTSGADALILDLEDSVAPTRLPHARSQISEFLRAQSGDSGPQLWVRVNPLSGNELLQDLTAIIAADPVGIMLPKAASPAEVVQVGHYLSALETREGRAPGSTRIIVIATETPQALLSMNAYATPTPRLAALTWGAEDLSAALGADNQSGPEGTAPFTFQLARSMCLVAAAAGGVPAFDAVHVNFRDLDGLAQDAARARRDGFTGKLAIHPDQIEPIHAAFSPTHTEIADARRIVEAFAASPGTGVLNIDGRMVDRPHLVRARRTLERAS